MTTYHDLFNQYGENNVKQCGNKVIVIDRNYRQVVGYTIDSYDGYTPDVLKEKIYSDISNINGGFDEAYDWLYGTPDGTVLPDFTKAVRVVNS